MTCPKCSTPLGNTQATASASAVKQPTS
jgi:hypothetical protein